MSRPVTIAACLALVALPLAGCGDDDDDEGMSASTRTATQQQRESVGHNDPRDGTAWSSNSWAPFIGRRS